MNFLDKLTISQRIMLGFTGVLLLGLFITLINFFSLNEFRNTFKLYMKESINTNLMLTIDKDISELHRNILIYSQTGTPAAFSQLKNFYKELQQDANQLYKQRAFGDSATQQRLIQLQQSVERFEEKIDVLQRQYQYRDELVNNTLASLFVDTGVAIGKLATDSSKIKKKKTVSKLWFANNDIAQAEVLASQYFINHQYNLKKQVERNILNVLAILNDEQSFVSEPEIQDEINRLTLLMKQMKKVFNEAVQADRDYLFLVNAVIAGESAELIILSESLKAESLNEQSALFAKTNQDVEFNQKVTLFSYLLSTLLAVIIIVLSGRTISKPLKSITQTFSLLAKGEAVTEIPGVNRQDEIGSLARAANIFHQTNLHTKELLTQAKINTQHLEERELALETKNDELSNFTHVVSHDLKTPIRGIAELSSWVVDDLGNDIPDKVKHNLDRIQLRVEKMESLIEDLLEYSKQGKIIAKNELIEPITLIKEIIDLQIIPSGFNVKVSGSSSSFYAAKVPLQVSVRNLLANAIAHHDKTKGNIGVRCYLEEHYCVFEVSDDGPGIPKAAQERIFILFQALDKTKNTSGLGLAYAKRMVEAHGGYIKVESNPEVKRGTTFYVYWPISKASVA